jgi:hypothetical protein
MGTLLSKDEWDVINAVEQIYRSKGKFPSLRTLSNVTNITQVDVTDILKNPLVRTALDNRGIEWRTGVTSNPLLTGEQIATIQLLLDISDKRPLKEKLASLGVSYTKLAGWRKNPKFMDAYREASEALYGESLPEVHRSVIQEAVSGSYAHQKLVLAITGRWDEKKRDEELNVRYVLMKVLEIIQTHVDNPETLNAIAGEFEAILNPAPKQIAVQAQPITED